MLSLLKHATTSLTSSRKSSKDSACSYRATKMVHPYLRSQSLAGTWETFRLMKYSAKADDNPAT